MVEATNSLEDSYIVGSRKNSILVKNEDSASRQNLQSAHPHFVEQILPHRSPPASVSGQPDLQLSTQQLAPQVSGSAQQLEPQTQVSPTSQQQAHTQPQSQIQQPQNFNLKTGPTQTKERLDQFHFGSAVANHEGADGAHANSAGGTGIISGTVPFPGGISSPQGVPQGALLAQTQAEAQNVGPKWTQPASPHAQIVQPPAPPSHPSRVGSPSGPGSESEGGSAGHFAGRATSKQPTDPRIPMDDGKIHILLGVTGSLHISNVKSIITKLLSIYGDRVAIQVIITPAAEKMIASSAAGKEHKELKESKESKDLKEPKEVKESKEPRVGVKAEHIREGTPSAAPHPNLREKEPHPNLRIWHDSDEWETWRGRNDPVIHIELRRWADILVIAPLSANTLGKIAMGLCDNLLTNVVRAWNAQYPILIAPAMVAYAYNHPATKHHLKTIREEMKWIEILRPTEKVAGSTGGIGMGGMMPWNEIVDRVVHKLGGYPDEDDDEDDDDDDDDSPRGRRSSGNLNNDLDDDDDDDEEEDDEDILKDGIESTH